MPKPFLAENDLDRAWKQVVREGLMTETMTTLTGGAFLVAMALLLGANNVQIGVIACLPSIVNLFQLAAIWLVNRLGSRRKVSVLCSVLARVPLALIGLLPLAFSGVASVMALTLFLLLYYLFAGIAGASWNAWMKDLVPENMLGLYFSRRSRLMQVLNTSLSLLLALAIEFIKRRHPDWQLPTYGIMFAVAGAIGLAGVLFLRKVPEPVPEPNRENLKTLLARPLKDQNFRLLLLFNCLWSFSTNLFTPFFTVYLMRGMNLPLPFIVGFTILAQLASIFTIGLWGRLGDRYSNKTVIAICVPLYIFFAIAWCFVGLYQSPAVNLSMLVVLYLISGTVTAGINLSLTNIGLKLAPARSSIVYLSVKNMVTSVFAGTAPLIGGLLADHFSGRRLALHASWTGPRGQQAFQLLSLHDWNFLFAIGAGCMLIAFQFLAAVKESGEVEKTFVVKVMRSALRVGLKNHFITGNLINVHRKIKQRILPTGNS